MRIPLKVAAVAAVMVLLVVVADQLSPWPSAMLIRYALDTDGKRTNAILAGRVPAGVAGVLNESYDPGDPDARLDVFYPAQAQAAGSALLTIVWVHGGSFLGGSKDQIASYAKILAGAGYTVAGVDYSLAPERTYPTPLRQVNAALAYLVKNAARLHVDPNRLVLAGDSAGALISAQLAGIVTSPGYASRIGINAAIEPRQLVGVLLYCGTYDMGKAARGERIGWLVRTAMWSYSGRRDFVNDSKLATLSILDYVTAQFPATFISVGNADPLAPQSRRFAGSLERLGVQVDALFFPDDYAPPLPHEYQFRLDLGAAQQALQQSLQFLAARR